MKMQDSPDPAAPANGKKEGDLEAGPSGVQEAGQDMTVFFQEVNQFHPPVVLFFHSSICPLSFKFPLFKLCR